MAQQVKWGEIVLWVMKCIERTGCSSDDLSMESLKEAAVQAMQEVTPYIGFIPHYQKRQEIVLPEGARVFDVSALDCPVQIKKVFCPETCETLREGCPPDPVRQQTCGCETNKDEPCNAPGKPTYWEWVGDEIWFSPTPDKSYTFEVTYCREPNIDVCKQVIDPDTEEVIDEWQFADFPVMFRSVMAQLMLGHALFKIAGQEARATHWTSIAENRLIGLIQIIREQNRPPRPAPGVFNRFNKCKHPGCGPKERCCTREHVAVSSGTEIKIVSPCTTECVAVPYENDFGLPDHGLSS